MLNPKLFNNLKKFQIKVKKKEMKRNTKKINYLLIFKTINNNSKKILKS